MAGRNQDDGPQDRASPRGDAVLALQAHDLSSDSVIQSLLQSSPDNIMLLDQDYRVLFINWTIPSLTPQGVMGTSVLDYVPAEHRDMMTHCFERVQASGIPDRYETVSHEGGGTHHWESRVGPVFRDGAVVAYVVTSSDVTERRQAATQRDRFFEMSLDIIAMANMEGRFVRVNRAFERLLGYTPEEMTQVPYANFVHPDDVERTAQATQHLAGGSNVIDFENRYRHKRGGYRWLSWTATFDDQLGLLFAVARDVTESKAREGALRHSQKMEAVGQLAGGIAHDFNNLMLTITANAEFARSATTEERKEHLDEIEAAVNRATQLTKKLLMFSRKQPARLVATDLNQVVIDTHKLVRRVIPASIDLDVATEAGLDPVEADATQLEQVIINLCVNARDAMPTGGTIRVRTASVDQSERIRRPDAKQTRGYVLLTVSDNGPGIANELRDHIFEPFFTTKEPGKGTGLGLATAYAIVQQHGGIFELDAEPGTGARFDIYLPIAEITDEPAEVPAPVRTSTRPGQETILVAEDESMVRDVVTAVLERAGYRVLHAADGEEAVQVFGAHRDNISLVLMDVVMPKLSGASAWQQIQRLQPDTRVLFTTGYMDPETAEALDAEQLLRKPYPPDELLRRVRSELDSAPKKTEKHSA